MATSSAVPSGGDFKLLIYGDSNVLRMVPLCLEDDTDFIGVSGGRATRGVGVLECPFGVTVYGCIAIFLGGNDITANTNPSILAASIMDLAIIAGTRAPRILVCPILPRSRPRGISSSSFNTIAELTNREVGNQIRLRQYIRQLTVPDSIASSGNLDGVHLSSSACRKMIHLVHETAFDWCMQGGDLNAEIATRRVAAQMHSTQNRPFYGDLRRRLGPRLQPPQGGGRYARVPEEDSTNFNSGAGPSGIRPARRRERNVTSRAKFSTGKESRSSIRFLERVAGRMDPSIRERELRRLLGEAVSVGPQFLTASAAPPTVTGQAPSGMSSRMSTPPLTTPPTVTSQAPSGMSSRMSIDLSPADEESLLQSPGLPS